MTRKKPTATQPADPVEQSRGWRRTDREQREARVARRFARNAAEDAASTDELNALVSRGNRMRGH